MGRQRDRMDEVRFHCSGCGHRFVAAPDRVIDAPDDPWHPWQYEAACTQCNYPASQDPRERSLLKAWASATGPKTPEGKAASAANLIGHPDAEARQRTRWNALRHGLTARVATYFPAKPGRYPHCEGCEYLDTICWQQTACLKRTELFLQHHVAFETKNPELLTALNADTHANLRAIFDDMIRAVLVDGARLKSPEWYYDKEGTFHLASYIDEETGQRVQIEKIEAHPLLARLKDMIQALNIGLSDLGMTPREIEKQEEIRGQLDGNSQRQEDLLEYQRRQTESLEALSALINRSREAAAKDPVLIEHQQREPEA